MKHLKFLFLASILFFSFACKKTENTPYSNSNVPDAKDVVMYEVNPRVFAERDALKAITERLDEIKALGVNVIWIMPIYEQGVFKAKDEDGGGSPYSIKDYRKIDPEYGSLEDLQNLVMQAHKRGMAVILDWVPNHTSWDNAWISDHPEYYTRNKAGEIIHPAGTDWTDVADLNYANHDMRAAMIDAMKYWFEVANIDGYRVDALDFIPEIDFLQQMTSELREFNKNRRILLLAEGAEKNYAALGFDMDYGWAFYNRLAELYEGTTSLRDFFCDYIIEKSIIPAGKSRLYFTTNHDKSAWNKTDVQFFGGQKAAMSAFVLTATLAGAPLIYSTQEIGREERVPFFTCTPIDWNANPEVLNEYKQVMSAYTSTTAFTGDEIYYYGENSKSSNVLAQYIQYLKFRRNSPDKNTKIICFTRSNGEEKALVAVNVSGKTQTNTLPFANDSAKNLISGETETIPETIELQPYEYRLWKME